MNLTDDKINELRKDFPILQRKIHGKPLVYLDNAATTQKPKQVIDAISRFYSSENANIHRGVYTLSEEATAKYGESKQAIAKFINASPEEIIFTRSTTESLNLLAYTVHSILDKGKKDIVLTELEHHSNLVPWQQFAKRHGMKLKFIKLKKDFTLDHGDAESKISSNTAILSLAHVSNALGTINDIKSLVKMGKDNGAITIVDAAQSIDHLPVAVKSIVQDFLAISSHKMLGPTGLGVLYGKKQILEKLPPFHFGGDMIKRVSYHDAEWNDIPMKFEAGTPHIAGAIGLHAALDYIDKLGKEHIAVWEKKLLGYALDKIPKNIKIYNAGVKHNTGILSFNIDHVHAHDVASLMDDEAICIRGGHHCAMPLMESLGITGTARASFFFYNTYSEVDAFLKGLKKVQKIFKLS